MFDRFSTWTAVWVSGLLLASTAAPGGGGTPVGTAVTYQGRLSLGSEPVDGDVDLRFRLYDGEVVGAQVGPELVANTLAVAGGVLTLDLDFGEGVFGENLRWLEIDVRMTGEPDFVTLSPRQAIRPAPVAQFALNASAVWQSDGDDIFYEGGRVGIGVTAPTTPLAVMMEGGSNPVGITQGQLGGNSTMELTTSDANGDQATRVLLKGGSGGGNVADIAFYRGARGEEVCTLFIEGEDGHVGIGTDSPNKLFTVFGEARIREHLGVGLVNANNRLDVSDEIDGLDGVQESYVTHFHNRATSTNGGGPDVMLIEVDVNQPDDTTNFALFIANGFCQGAIQGNGAGGLTYATVACDYAEELERLDADEVIGPGDVVGVFGGRISKRTRGADWVMVVSTAPAILGGAVEEASGPDSPREPVAFLGQVPVRVRGAVSPGDYLVTSGLDDGTAVAVSERSIGPAHAGRVVGRAWQGSSDAGVKLINTVVGLPQTGSAAPLASTVRRQAEQIGRLQAELDELRSLRDGVAALTERLAALEAAR